MELERHGTELLVVAVDVGLAALARRLGLRRLAAAARALAPLDGGPPRDGRGHRLQLASEEAAVHRLSPGGLMQVVARLPDERGREVLQAVAPATAAGALAAASPDLAGRLLAELPAEDAGALLGRMPIDDAALALRGLAPERSAPLLERLPRERVDVVTGAVMTGVIGTFVVVACAATLHADGRSIDTARDPALALEPLAGNLAATLFGAVLLGAALLTAAILPLATAYSVTDLLGYEAALDDPLREAPSSTRATPSSWRSGAGSCCCRARRWSRSCSSPGRSTRSSCCR